MKYKFVLLFFTVMHEKQWPGPPRQLIAEEVLTENESHAWFSWKPPYDGKTTLKSSIFFLLAANLSSNLDIYIALGVKSNSIVHFG